MRRGPGGEQPGSISIEMASILDVRVNGPCASWLGNSWSRLLKVPSVVNGATSFLFSLSLCLSLSVSLCLSLCVSVSPFFFLFSLFPLTFPFIALCCLFFPSFFKFSCALCSHPVFFCLFQSISMLPHPTPHSLPLHHLHRSLPSSLYLSDLGLLPRAV